MNNEYKEIAETLLMLLSNATGFECENEILAVEIIANTIEKTVISKTTN